MYKKRRRRMPMRGGGFPRTGDMISVDTFGPPRMIPDGGMPLPDYNPMAGPQHPALVNAANSLSRSPQRMPMGQPEMFDFEQPTMPSIPPELLAFIRENMAAQLPNELRAFERPPWAPSRIRMPKTRRSY